MVQEPLLPAAPTDSGVGMAGHQQGAARQIRGMAKPRSIAGSMYTLARSMRIFPTALSPHRCASTDVHLPLLLLLGSAAVFFGSVRSL